MARKTKDKDVTPVRRPKRRYITSETRTVEDEIKGPMSYPVEVLHWDGDEVVFEGPNRCTLAKDEKARRLAETKAARRNTPVSKVLDKLDKAQAVVDRIGRLTVNGSAVLTVAEFVDLDRALDVFRGWLGTGEE